MEDGIKIIKQDAEYILSIRNAGIVIDKLVSKEELTALRDAINQQLLQDYIEETKEAEQRKEEAARARPKIMKVAARKTTATRVRELFAEGKWSHEDCNSIIIRTNGATDLQIWGGKCTSIEGQEVVFTEGFRGYGRVIDTADEIIPGLKQGYFI